MAVVYKCMGCGIRTEVEPEDVCERCGGHWVYTAPMHERINDRIEDFVEWVRENPGMAAFIVIGVAAVVLTADAKKDWSVGYDQHGAYTDY